MKTIPAIYGIGNPIVDIIFHVSDDDIKTLGLQKGTMSLVTKKRQTEIINYLQIGNASIFPGGSGINLFMDKDVTDFPDPDSPTIPSTSPFKISKEILFTAFATPASV